MGNHITFKGVANPHDCAAAKAKSILESRSIQIERKRIVCTLNENSLGRFVRISEEVGRKHQSIIVPVSGIEEFTGLLQKMLSSGSEPSA